MKLVTNFKDYYDYVIRKYGVDPKAVYERVCQSRTKSILYGKGNEWSKTGLFKPHHIEYPTSRDIQNYMIGFCGTIYSIWWANGKFYYGNESKQIPGFKSMDFGYYKQLSEHDYHLRATNANDIAECPVVLLGHETWGTDGYSWSADVKNPKLSDFGFASIVPAEECFIQITNFLLKEKVITDSRTDKEKIVSKGFDLKTSFRKM